MKIKIILLAASIVPGIHAAAFRYCSPFGDTLSFSYMSGQSGKLSGAGSGSSNSQSNCGGTYCQVGISNQYVPLNPVAVPNKWPVWFSMNPKTDQLYVVPCKNPEDGFYIYNAPCDVTQSANGCNSACFNQRTPYADQIFHPTADPYQSYCNTPTSNLCDAYGFCPKQPATPK